MTTIFCSAKLSKLLKLQRKESSASNEDLFGSWNAHLFPVNGKKFLIFVNKQTLYSIFIADFRVAEFKELHSLLFSTIVLQLKADEMYTPQRAEFFRNHFTGLLFSTTDNDKKTIGCINEYILEFTTAFDLGHNTAKKYQNGLVATYMNEMLMRPLGLDSPATKLNYYLEKNAV